MLVSFRPQQQQHVAESGCHETLELDVLCIVCTYLFEYMHQASTAICRWAVVSKLVRGDVIVTVMMSAVWVVLGLQAGDFEVLCYIELELAQTSTCAAGGSRRLRLVLSFDSECDFNVPFDSQHCSTTFCVRVFSTELGVYFAFRITADCIRRRVCHDVSSA